MSASPRLAPDVSTWPTVAEASAALGCHPRTVLRHAEERRLELRKRQRPGKKPENVCNPADVERLMPTAHVMPSEPESSGETVQDGLHLSPVRPKSAVHPWQNALEVIAAILQNNPDNSRIATIPPAQKLWLTLDEAAELSGLPRTILYEACRAGKLVAVCRNQWLIKRSSLEAFEG